MSSALKHIRLVQPFRILAERSTQQQSQIPLTWYRLQATKFMCVKYPNRLVAFFLPLIRWPTQTPLLLVQVAGLEMMSFCTERLEPFRKVQFPKIFTHSLVE